MKKGDIVLTLFPFTDLSGSKRRPAMVLFAGKEDNVLCFITSKIENMNEFDFVVYPNDQNKLKVTSVIRISKIATINTSLILGKLGETGAEITNQINDRLLKMLKL